ncbi:hypothetical protein VM1G_02057 [Cytospora mali]|uniref:2EXR domain-containing protein n=1 Tax=Cytospora mali TaxID=578113 RepID=A0A194VQN0_CYTMA|nr:hypothetical protein VM1G_02057 [Valsa mali]
MPTQFHQFKQLPPELRTLIWEYALPDPRVFDIYPASTSQKTPAQQGLRFANQRDEPPPATSVVCRESRSFVLHHYSPLTLSSTTKYVDLSRDILLLESCLHERGLLRTLGFMSKMPQIRDNLRNLAFGTTWSVVSGVEHPFLDRKSGKTSTEKFLQRLAVFPSLERIVFVLHQEIQSEVRELPRAAGVWDGHLNQNATLYLAGTRPPPVKAILALSHCSLRPEDLPRPSRSTFCTIPWVEDKPALPHVNELLYYPLDIQGGNADLQGSDERYSDWHNRPWPTAKDLGRFARTLSRAIDTGVENLLADGPGDGGNYERRMRKADSRDEEEQCSGKRWRRSTTVATTHFKLPRIEGASLLWRYTLPASEALKHWPASWDDLITPPCSPTSAQDGCQCVP